MDDPHSRSSARSKDCTKPRSAFTVLAEFSNIERSNIQYRLNSGRAQYVAAGGKLGRKEGYRKSDEEMREQYKNAIALLKKGYSVRAVAKLEGISHTTVQKLKNKFI